MPKCYNIIFNSRKGTFTNKADITYSFDFKNIPDGEYKATFTYSGEYNATIIASSYRPAFVYINLGKANDYQAGDITGSNKFVNSNFLGTLFPFISATGSLLSCKRTDNPSVYIHSLANNQVNIKVLNNLDELWTDTAAGQLNHYVLVLHLELVKEYDISLTNRIEQKINEYEYEEVEEEVGTYEIPKIFESS